jgi:AmmeMemoRadiSam system protein B
MLMIERPRLRPYLQGSQPRGDPHYVYLVDRLGLSPEPQRVTIQEWGWLELFDGQRTLRDVQAEVMRRQGGLLLPLERLAHLACRLDQASMLDGPRYQALVNQPIRPPRCIGCYEGDPAALRRQIERLFTCPEGPGLPRSPRPDRGLCAALLPHIDYPRGGITYAWGFKEVAERTDASLFVIIGTSHFSYHRFTLTRKDFQTPLGIARTDQPFLDRLARHFGDGLFDDELMAHLPEHSIELEVVFLQYLFEGRKPIRIVPLVVGSFQDCIDDGTLPHDRDDISRMVEALRRAEVETGEPICYIISGDLAHIGPKFGDPEPVRQPALTESHRRDRALIERAQNVDFVGYFRQIAEEHDSRRICGLPPTYTVLTAVRPGRGELLHYDQYVHPRGHESVSFASMAFYR